VVHHLEYGLQHWTLVHARPLNLDAVKRYLHAPAEMYPCKDSGDCNTDKLEAELKRMARRKFKFVVSMHSGRA
jgi:hypothetical protein